MSAVVEIPKMSKLLHESNCLKHNQLATLKSFFLFIVTSNSLLLPVSVLQ